MSFKLKSGNRPAFKMMGASPVKNNGETYNERVTKENKRLKEVYEQQMKSYSDSTASYENRMKAYDLFESKGNLESKRKEFNRLRKENKKRKIFIKAPDDYYLLKDPEDSTNVYPKKPDLTKERIAEILKPNKPVKPKYHKTITNVPPLKPIIPSLIKPSKPVTPKPVEVPDFPDRKEGINRKDWDRTRLKRKKKKQTKKVRRPKGKRIRNLVTGSTNRTFRRTGTSKRK
mgnify:CR=1 FL=1|tara:strand:+ start:66 stop:755 length:690 start_codon:yes stop_codon:yes gene_type:complete